MTERLKIIKLMGRIQLLIFKLNAPGHHPAHQQLKQAYYLEKMDRLKSLLFRIDETKNQQALMDQMNQLYPALFHQWRKDLRWITKVQRQRANTKPIL